MKYLAIILTLVSGLYFNGQANAEGVKTDTTNPDSSGMTVGQLNILENVSIEAGEAAEPSYRIQTIQLRRNYKRKRPAKNS